MAPLVIVKLASVMLGVSGPSAAKAALNPENDNTVTTAALKTNSSVPTEKERQAAQRVADLRELPFGPSPLYYPPGQAAAQPKEAVPPLPDISPTFHVNAIFVTSTTIIAIIDTKPYKLGDRLANTGWVISDIDNDKRVVSIYDPKSGRVVTQNVDAPTSRRP
ncbi:MAG TPA: hypothetical protein VG711_06245 [Phycisphaerales bacterium]|nr:hypothetical protein [Phycisphaerales bacterium]